MSTVVPAIAPAYVRCLISFDVNVANGMMIGKEEERPWPLHLAARGMQLGLEGH